MATIAGLTGGIASGKSFALHIFKDLGAYVIDYDELSREVVLPCSKAWWKIMEFFDKDIFKKDLKIDRKKLRRIVFDDLKKKEILEEIIHPEARKERIKRVEAIKKIEPNAVIVVDTPLLIEKGNPKEFDVIVVVYISEEMQIRRLKERDRITKEDAIKMLKMQMPLREKLKFADFVINNEGTEKETREQVRKIYKELHAISLNKENIQI